MRPQVNTSKTKLESVLAPLLKAAGYRKRRLTWHPDWPDAITVFNVQKSQWGDQFYLNFGIYLKALGNEKTPPEYACHVRARMEELMSDMSDWRRLCELLDYDKPFDDAIRLGEIADLVKQWGLPWLEKHAQLEALRGLVCSEQGNRLPICGLVHTYFQDHPKDQSD